MEENKRKSILQIFDSIDYFSTDKENENRFKNLYSTFCRQIEAERIMTIDLPEEKNREIVEMIRLFSCVGAEQKEQNIDFSTVTFRELINLHEIMTQYYITLFVLILDSADKHFDEKLSKVFSTTWIYGLLQQISQSLEKRRSATSKCLSESIPSQLAESLKSYFYLVLNIDKQSDYFDELLEIFEKTENKPDSGSLNSMLTTRYLSSFQDSFSRCVYEQRKKMKLTQSKLSKISGVDRTMIAKIESLQQKTTLATAFKLLVPLQMGVMIYPLKKDRRASIAPNPDVGNDG